MRRLLFGLTSLIAIDQTHLPEMIHSQLPQIVQQIASLCKRMLELRAETLQNKEKEYLQEVNEEDESDFESEEEDQEEFAELNNRILELKA